ncbi:MAG: hypothetical protein OEV59_08225 [Deltaproteobacteria bacterium]|nr:hypothetical protein [Deltaproteobacteria bacterium]
MRVVFDKNVVKRWGALLFAGAVIFALNGCVVRQMLKSDAYTAALNRWTSTAKVYKDIEMRLSMTATFKSLEYRKAYVEEFARKYQIDTESKDRLLAREIETHGAYNEFFVVAYTPLYQWNDLEQKKSVWKLYLMNKNGAKTLPIEITKVDHTEAFYIEFFPYLDHWSNAYVVKFPRYDSTGAVSLGEEDAELLRIVVTGPLGNGEATWKLDKKAPVNGGQEEK